MSHFRGENLVPLFTASLAKPSLGTDYCDQTVGLGMRLDETNTLCPEEVRHASRNADSACPFLYWRDGKKGHAESAFRVACRTSFAFCQHSSVRSCGLV